MNNHPQDRNNMSKDVWQLPNPLILLFSRFLDQFFLQKFVEDCKESAEILWSGREMVLYSNEIELLATAIYYFGAICTFSATPGQLFGEVRQFHYLSTETVEASSISHRFWTGFVYVCLPYLYQKKSKIWETISDAATAALDSDHLDHLSSTPNQEQVSESPSQNEASNMKKEESISFLEMTLNAFKSSIRSISSEVDKCLERISSVAQEINLALFLNSGLYLEIPLRLTSTVLLTQKNSFFQAKLKSLSWLLSFRLLILFYYGARVFLSELDEQQTTISPAPQIPSQPVNESLTSNATPLETPQSRLIAHSEKQYQCPLCLDAIAQPAVIPCGHMGCWNCLLSYASKTPTNSDNTSSSVSSFSSSTLASVYRPNVFIKCPVCRYEFQTQKIRPIVL